MAVDLRLPNITGKNDNERINQICRYLYQLTEQLNFSLNDLGNDIEKGVGSGDINQTFFVSNKTETIDDDALTLSIEQTLEKNYPSIRDQVIKSAEFTKAVGDEWTKTFSSKYVATNDYNAFKTLTEGDITSLVSNLGSLQTSTEGSISSINTSIGNLNTNLDTLRTDTEQDILEITTNHTELAGDLGTFKESTNGSIQSINANVGTLNTEMSTLQGNVSGLSTDVNGVKSRLDVAEEDIGDLTDTLDTVSADLDALATGVGTFMESANLTINANSTGIEQLYSYTAGIRSNVADIDVDNQTRIITGKLYEENSQPVYGVGVGLIQATTDVNGVRVVDRSNLLGTFTADEIAFWKNNVKLASITPTEINFAHGMLKVSGADVSGKITASDGLIGGWDIGASSIQKSYELNGIQYLAHMNAPSALLGASTANTIAFGVSVDTDYVFSVSYNGRLKATNADISGKITSSEGSIGGWVISDGFIRSANGVVGTFVFTNPYNGMSENPYSGYLFTFLVSDGIEYRVYEFNNVSSRLLHTSKTPYIRNTYQGSTGV